MKEPLSSRERMLRTIAFQDTDYLPCCFSAFSALYARCRDPREFVTRQVELGLDAVVSIDDLPISHDPRVRNEQWQERPAHGGQPILHSRYQTPAGALERVVARSEDWEHGDRIPFISDLTIARASRHLIAAGDSLQALEHLLVPPTAAEVAAYARGAAEAKARARELGLATMAGFAMHGDMACWLSGIHDLMLMCMDAPEFVRAYLHLIENWNRKRMEVVLAHRPDIYVRRGWYENADFWSPALYREFLLSALERDVQQVHAAGARLGYIMSCSSMPLLDLMLEAGVDILLGVDPAQDRMLDMTAMKEKTHGRMALWGGVCGYLTVERGSPQDIRSEVRRSIAELGPRGGLVLAPVTNVRADTPQTWQNIEAMIDEWKLTRSMRGS